MSKPPKSYTRSMEKMSTTLLSNESVVASIAASAIVNGSNWPGALAITNERLVFHSDAGAMMLKMKSALALSTINSHDYSAAVSKSTLATMLWDKLTVYSQGAEHSFLILRATQKDATENFLKKLSDINSGSKAPRAGSTSLSEELVALALLLDKGLITEDEFKKAKNKIL